MGQKGQDNVLLKVRDLEKHFPVKKGLFQRRVGAVRAVEGISFDIYEGETFGLVGEAGSGKSTAARAILQLLRPTGGSVQFRGRELTGLRGNQLRRLRREMQMIFQDPYAALSPRMTVGAIVAEPLNVHGLGNAARRGERVEELLALVGLNPYFAARRPYEFSGGQRQRMAMARALATNPSFIVADEPTFTLDVVVQMPIIELLNDLKGALGLTYLFLTRDLSLASHVCDRLAIMDRGRIVELSGDPVKPS
jgi:oligopeptide transport system ATP-binding protein